VAKQGKISKKLGKEEYDRAEKRRNIFSTGRTKNQYRRCRAGGMSSQKKTKRGEDGIRWRLWDSGKGGKTAAVREERFNTSWRLRDEALICESG